MNEQLKKLNLKEKCALLSGKDIWHSAGFSEKGIKSITLHDGPHGVRIAGVENTIYPNLCLLACSFDRNAVYEIGRMIGNDCVKNNVDVLLAPGVNIKRTATGGRNFEYFSEDSFLTGELASEYVNGLQSTGTSATVKHFCCNNQENYRMSTSSQVDEEVLFNTYFVPFKKVIEKAKPDCLMTSYNLVNGERTNESDYLQRKVLREKLGFDGVIMSDWGAVTDRVKAVKGGCDLEMPGSNEESDIKLFNAVVDGEIDQDLVDESAKRMLKLINKHAKAVKKQTSFDTEEVVSDIIAECIVMLKNDDILPLKKGEKIGVYGDHAKTPLIQGGGCAMIKSGEIVSPLNLLNQLFDVVYVASDGDVSAFKGVDKVLAFVSCNSTDSEAYDRKDILINQTDSKNIELINSINENICVILQGGGVASVHEIPSKAILATYYGGQFYSQGLIKVLCGKSPSGRLAESFPMCLENSSAFLGQPNKRFTPYMEGDYVGYKYYTKKHIKTAYPFGFGLSYANIKYLDFRLFDNTIDESGVLRGEVDIQNQSEITAKEVVQIYYQNKKLLRLVYFDKVELQPYQKLTVKFEISAKEFYWFCDGEYTLFNESGKLIVAKNAEEPLCSFDVFLKGKRKTKIDESMLIEELVEMAGVKVVSKYFSKPLGCAMFSDENFVLPAENNRLSDDEFVNNTCMMMPLKNLASFGACTQADLQKIMADFQEEINKKS